MPSRASPGPQPLTASPLSLHPGPTGVCGFGGPYGDTVATGAYRAFRMATAAGHCGAFSGADGSRTGKPQGGNYAAPAPRASLPPPASAALLSGPLYALPRPAPPRRPAPLPSGPSASWRGYRTATQPFALAPGRPLQW